MRDLLDRNQLECGSLVANLDFEDVVEISQEVVNLMRKQAELRKIEIEIISSLPANSFFQID